MRRALRKCDDVSVRDAGQWSGVTPASVQRHKTKGFLVPYFRSKKLAVPLAEELLALLKKRDGRAA